MDNELCSDYVNARIRMTELGRELWNAGVSALNHNNRRLRDQMDRDKPMQGCMKKSKRG